MPKRQARQFVRWTVAGGVAAFYEKRPPRFKE